MREQRSVRSVSKSVVDITEIEGRHGGRLTATSGAVSVVARRGRTRALDTHDLRKPVVVLVLAVIDIDGAEAIPVIDGPRAQQATQAS